MAAARRLAKRSLAVAGHRTSISLEEPFWRELGAIAARRGVPIAALVAAIDRERAETNLSSAIRVFVLTTVKEDARPAGATGPG